MLSGICQSTHTISDALKALASEVVKVVAGSVPVPKFGGVRPEDSCPVLKAIG